MKHTSTKTTALLVRTQPEEKEAFRRAAQLAGIPVSAWIRERLRKAARMELVDAGEMVPFLVRAAAAP